MRSLQMFVPSQLTKVCWSADIVKRSGVLRGHDSTTGGSNGADQATSVPKEVQEAVDHAMRRLANYLLTGEVLSSCLDTIMFCYNNFLTVAVFVKSCLHLVSLDCQRWSRAKLQLFACALHQSCGVRDTYALTGSNCASSPCMARRCNLYAMRPVNIIAELNRIACTQCQHIRHCMNFTCAQAAMYMIANAAASKLSNC